MITKRFLISKTIADLDESGYWKATVDLVVGVTEDGILDTRTISAASIDKDLESAVATAATSVEKQFEELNGNLFNLPKDKDGQYIPYPLIDSETSDEHTSS